MKLLGIEFCDFACFERQFVPIRAGMNLLVGRNNAGKTALLRGLSALSALPFGDPPRQVPTDLSGYLRPNATGLTFEAVCLIDDSDRCFLEGVPADRWAKILADGTARWKFSTAQSRQVSFVRCAFVIPEPRGGQEDKEIPILDGEPTGRVNARRFRYTDLSPVAAAQNTFRAAATGDRSV